MRHLGIDYGEKRMGLALSDPEGIIAMPYETIANSKSIAGDIAAIVKKEDVKKIVVGIPITFSGGESRQTKSVKEFAEDLRNVVGIPVDFENELLTTRLAEREGVPKDHLDKAAAALILQSYLDKKVKK